MGLKELMEEERREREEFDAQWSLGDYDNADACCLNCGRSRLCICPNGKRRCEKCNWCPEENRYVMEPAP